jgi:hypothetical protein
MLEQISLETTGEISLSKREILLRNGGNFYVHKITQIFSFIHFPSIKEKVKAVPSYHGTLVYIPVV